MHRERIWLCYVSYNIIYYSFDYSLVFMTFSVHAESDSYVVAKLYGHRLLLVTSAGARTVIYQFSSVAYPQDVEVDSLGNYIVQNRKIQKNSDYNKN